MYTKKEHLSQSSGCTMARCPARYFFASGCRLQKGEPHCALLFGTAIHAAIGWAYRGVLDKACEVFNEIYGDTVDPGGIRTKAKAKQVLRNYMEAHKGQPLYIGVDPPKGIDIEERVSADEVPFAIDVGIEIPVVGRIDRIGRNVHSKDLWGVEFKTSREVGSRYFNNFVLAPQVLTYHLALQLLVDEIVRGIYVEGLQVCKTKVQTVAFPFYVEPHHDEAIMGWYQWVYRNIQTCEETGVWPQNFAACAPYSMFGVPGYPCEYSDLCLSPDWRALAEGIYEVGEVRPFTIKQEPETNA